MCLLVATGCLLGNGRLLQVVVELEKVTREPSTTALPNDCACITDL